MKARQLAQALRLLYHLTARTNSLHATAPLVPHAQLHCTHGTPPCAHAALHCSLQVRHGNEDTFREMLRIKRSVAASFSAVHLDSATAAEAEAGQAGGTAAAAGGGLDSMEALEAAAEAVAAASKPALKGFVSAGGWACLCMPAARCCRWRGAAGVVCRDMCVYIAQPSWRSVHSMLSSC